MHNPLTPPAVHQDAATIGTFQALIARQAMALREVVDKTKTLKEEVKDILQNDTQLSELEQAADVHNQKVKERKAVMNNTIEVVGVKQKIKELQEQKKELEESMSNNLVNYHSLTNSTSLDTPTGEQVEFVVRARIKPQQLRLF